MSYRDDQDNISLYVFVMQNSFDLAPDLLIMRSSHSSWGGLFSSSDEHIERVPHNLTPVDLQTLLDYFDLIAFDRFMKYFGQQTPSSIVYQPTYAVQAVEEDFSQYRLEHRLASAHNVNAISDFTNILGVVDQTWNTIKSIFSSSSKSAIVSSITSLGFSQFASTCLVQSYVGLPAERLDSFKNYIINSVQVPSDKVSAFQGMWDWAAFTDSGNW
jgi:hypothetical protein